MRTIMEIYIRKAERWIGGGGGRGAGEGGGGVTSLEPTLVLCTLP